MIDSKYIKSIIIDQKGESIYRAIKTLWKWIPFCRYCLGQWALGSGELVKLCEQELGWKKSTTYTVLKKLCERGVFQNVNAVVTSLIRQEQVQKYESEQFIDRTFGGSLPRFITAFMNDKTLSKQEADELKSLIDSYKER